MATTLLHSYRLRTGRSYIGLVAKRSYRIVPGRAASPTDDAPEILTRPEYLESKSAPGMFRMVRDSDLFSCVKPTTDVLLHGHAEAIHGPVSMVDTALEVGGAKKRVRVWGDRRIQVGAGGALQFGEPEPFTRMPLIWDHAYGGRDAYAERKLWKPQRDGAFRARDAADDEGAYLYPRNGAGRGFALALDLERLAGRVAPNLEDPDDPVSPERLLARDPLDWIDRPVAACYAAIDWHTFPRASFLIPPVFRAAERPVRELALGALGVENLERSDLDAPADARLYNCAPAGLAACRLSGGERVKLVGLHRDREVLEFDLPLDPPRLRLEPPNAGRREIPSLLQTIDLEPGDDRVTLTWAGVLEVKSPFPDELLARMPHSADWPR